MMQNLFADLPAEIPAELVDVLAENEHIRIERIVSHGQSSDEGFWYDQAETEWVVVLTGEAKLQMKGDASPLHMKTGDHIKIAPRQKHRVEWTTPDEPTIWLAVFF